MKTTRRDALAHGGRIIATAAMLPFIPSLAYAKDDAELFAQHDKCFQLDWAHHNAIKKANLAYDAVRRQFPEAPSIKMIKWGRPDGTIVTKTISQQWDIDLAKAMRQAGVPAMEKNAKAAGEASMEAVAVFYSMRARTPLGMILKIQVAWSKERSLLKPQAKREAPGSLLLDLESFSGRRG